MGQILHRGARTTEAVRRAIQNSQESLRALSKRYGINQNDLPPDDLPRISRVLPRVVSSWSVKRRGGARSPR